MEVNAWGEPKPERLTDPAKARAWERMLVDHEWFDGEDGIAWNAQQRMLEEWDTPATTIVRAYNYSDGRTDTREFPSRARAEQYADKLADAYGDAVGISVSRKWVPRG